MKVVAFVGSPRENGNTVRIVGEILKGASEAGAETKVFSLNGMNIRPCQGCFHCRGAEECATKDDMQKVYAEIKEAQAVIIGSPVYMHQVSGQTKVFMDRLFPLIGPDFKPRFGSRKAVLVFSQGNPDPNAFKPALDDCALMLGGMGMQVVDTVIFTGGNDPEASVSNADLMTRARQIGQKLVK